jgi:zinc protease
MKTKNNSLIKLTQVASFVVLLVVLIALCSTILYTITRGKLGKPSDPVPVMENLITGVLPSGLRYFILENSTPGGIAYLTLAVKAGSVLEEDNERGLAHFVEHMAFNGTERFPEFKLINYLRSLGMRFGPEINAYTYYDETVYGIEVPVERDSYGIKRIPETALAVIDDWTRAVTFLPADVENERPVIMEEYRKGLGAWERIWQKWLPVLYKDSPYANRMPIGLPEIINEAPASRLKGFYKKWYKADNMALIIVGDFNGVALEASLTDHFKMEKPDEPVNRPLYDLHLPQKGNVEVLVLTDSELTNTNIAIYFKRKPQARRSDLSYFRSEIIDYLIDTMLDLRFKEALLKPETPHVSVSAETKSYATSSRFYVLSSEVKTGNAEAGLEDLLRIKETMLRYGFTDSDIETAVDILISHLRQQVMEKDKKQSKEYVDSLVDYYLNGGNYADVEWELEAIRKMLPNIKAKDINAVINDYFSSGDIKVFIFAPDLEQGSLPSEARIRQIIADSGKMEIAAPIFTTVGRKLLLSMPKRGSIVSESTDADTGIIYWELSNGARVILESTEAQNDEIIMEAMARGGTSSVAPEDYVSASLAIEMAQVSGLGPWSRPELIRKLSGIKVSLSPSVYSYYRGFSGSSNSGALKTFFEMLYLSFTDPRIDREAVQAMMTQYRTSLALRDKDPQTVFSDEINKTIYNEDPHFKPLELNELPKADIDKALAFIRKAFNPADYTFIFIGNMNLYIMREYVESYLAAIPRGESWNTWTDLNIKRPGKVEKIVYKGKERQSSVYMAWFSKTPYSDKLSVISEVLNEYLDIKLIDEIREKLGGVYSIYSDVSVSPIPHGELSMKVRFDCDPKRARELQTAVIAILNQTAGGVIDRDIFTKAEKAAKEVWEYSHGNNSIAKRYARSSVLQNLPLSRLDAWSWTKLYDVVTPADIQKVCGQLINDNKNGPTLVVLMPEIGNKGE